MERKSIPSTMDKAVNIVRTIFILLATAVYAYYQKHEFSHTYLYVCIFGVVAAFLCFLISCKRINCIDSDEKEPKWKPIILITIIVLLLIYGLHIASYKKAIARYEELFSSICLIVFVIAGIAVIPNFVRTVSGRQYAAGIALGKRIKDNKDRFLQIMLIAFIIRVVSTFLGMFLYKQFNPEFSGSMYKLWREAWSKGNTDVNHYLYIAENWYVAKGNDRLLIVFFPMFPLLIRFFNLFIGNSFISAQIINTILTSLAAGMLYKLLKYTMEESKAYFSALIFLVLPGAIFMNSTMSEPLFVLLTCISLYFLQKKKFVAAGLFAGLSGFTRSVGILLFVPIFIDATCEIVNRRKNDKLIAKTAITSLLGLGLSCSGTVAYLVINKVITGNAFMFSEYQKSNWNQGISYFFDTPRYMFNQARYMFQRSDTIGAILLPIVTIVVIFSALVIFIMNAKRLSAAFGAYFLVYFIIAMGCTWLLSSVRYMSVLVPFIACIALIPKTKTGESVTLSISILLYIAYLVCYMLRLSVY